MFLQLPNKFYGLMGCLCLMLGVLSSTLVHADPSVDIAAIQSQIRIANDEAWNLLSNKQEYDSALVILDSSLIIAEQHDLFEWQADSWSQKSIVHLYTLKLDLALDESYQALSIRRNLELVDKAANSHLNLGQIHNKAGNLDSALWHYQQGLFIYQKLADRSAIAQYQNSLADIYWQQDSLEKALQAGLRGLEIRIELDEPRDIIKSRLNLGNIYLALDDIEAAHAQYQLALKGAIAQKMPDYKFKASSNLLGLMIVEGDTSGALALAAKLLADLKERNPSAEIEYDDIGIALQKVGELYKLKGDTKVAKEYFMQGLRILEKGGFYQKVILHISLGELFYNDNELILALEQFENANQLSQNHNLPALQVKCLNWMALINSQKSKHRLAYQQRVQSDSIGKTLVQGSQNAVRLGNRLEKESMQSDLKDTQITLRNSIIGFLLLLAALAFVILRQYNKRTQDRAQINELLYKEEMEYLYAKADGQETERNRIADRLHDGVGALLTLASEQLSHTIDTELVNGTLTRIKNEVRNISKDIKASVLVHLGLEAAIEDLADQFNKATDINISTYFAKETEMELEALYETQAYFITSELLNNAVKHAEAEEINIYMTINKGQCEILVEDDGKGIAPQIIKNPTGNGIKSVQARAYKLNASCEFDSQLGQGTNAIVKIPLSSKNT